MSLQSKSLVGKEISALKPRLRLGFRKENPLLTSGLVCKDTFHGKMMEVKFAQCAEKYTIKRDHVLNFP